MNWELKENIDEMHKKLFKFNKNKDICHLNPYEMHERTRYYESKYEEMYVPPITLFSQNKNDLMRIELNELLSMLDRIGLTKDKLKMCIKSGTLGTSDKLMK